MIARMCLALVFALAGCVSQPKSMQSFDPAILNAHVGTLADIDNWKIKGRLSIRTVDGGQIGRLVWVRSDNTHEIDLYGSLGSGHVRIFYKPGYAFLEDSDGTSHTGASAQAVLNQYLGWEFPAEELPNWLVGSTYPSASSQVKWNTNGYVTSIEQSGWLVTLSHYASVGDYQLPTRYRMVAHGHFSEIQSGAEDKTDRKTQIKLIVNSWSLN